MVYALQCHHAQSPLVGMYVLGDKNTICSAYAYNALEHTLRKWNTNVSYLLMRNTMTTSQYIRCSNGRITVIKCNILIHSGLHVSSVSVTHNRCKLSILAVFITVDSNTVRSFRRVCGNLCSSYTSQNNTFDNTSKKNTQFQPTLKHKTYLL